MMKLLKLCVGPIALFPLDQERISLVWSTTHDHAEELVRMGPSELVDNINDAFVRLFEFILLVSFQVYISL